MSTLHKKGKDSSHSSSDKESSTHRSNISGIEQFSDINDFAEGEENHHCDILNTAHTEFQVLSYVENVEINADTGPPNSPIAESVGGHIESNPILRRTLSGGIRNTPVRIKNEKRKENLVRGGHKKLDSIEKIGEQDLVFSVKPQL